MRCGEIIDWDQYIPHMQQEHQRSQISSAQYSYVCLKLGCNFVATSEIELQAHYVQCPFQFQGVECHWGSCSKAPMSPEQLQNHISAEHLSIEARDARFVKPSPVPKESAPPAVHIGVIEGNNFYRKCEWVTDEDSKATCTFTGEDGKALQEHIEVVHLSPRQREGRYRGRSSYKTNSLLCFWNGCSRTTRFSQPQSLKEHVMIHTGCMTLLHQNYGRRKADSP